MSELFEEDWGVDDNPADDTEITTTLLYFSTTQLEEFKELCKEGMKKEFPNDFQLKANLPVFLLRILKRLYGKNETEKTLDAAAGREVERNLPWE